MYSCLFFYKGNQMSTAPTLERMTKSELLQKRYNWALWGVRQQIRDYYARKDALSIGGKNG